MYCLSANDHRGRPVASHSCWRTVVRLLAVSVLLTTNWPAWGQDSNGATSRPPSSPRAPADPQPTLFNGDCEPCRNCPINGVDCQDQTCGPELSWKAHRPLPWQIFAQGEYVGPHRPAHVPLYRVRVADEVAFAFRLTRDISPQPYELNVGDKIRVESLQDEKLDRELIIQPDGTITLRLLGQISAAGLTIEQLRQNLDRSYREFYKEPSITVTPLEVNTKLEDLRHDRPTSGHRRAIVYHRCFPRRDGAVARLGCRPGSGFVAR